jgi:hypothetical protein
VPGYPTWEINGELYPGEKSIEELEEISHLRAPAAASGEAAGDLAEVR